MNRETTMRKAEYLRRRKVWPVSWTDAHEVAVDDILDAFHYAIYRAIMARD